MCQVKIGAGVGGAINSLWISISNILFAELAKYLNHWENHRTQTEFEDALILKTFTFQFINSYTSLFYIAFIKVRSFSTIH